MKLSGIEAPDAVYAAHQRITQLNNDQFYEAAKALDLDVSSGMPNYRGPTPYWWEGEYLSDNAQRFQASRST